jgi:GntR family transcriptional regulator
MTFQGQPSSDQQHDHQPERPGAVPGYIYEWMVAAIAARIESGDLPANTPLPAERQLAREYEVSLGTARRATQILRERGLVITLRSKGTYVTARQPGHGG